MCHLSMALWRKMRGRKAAGSDQVKRATGEELLAGLPVSSTLRRSSVGSKTPGLQFTSKGEADGKVSVPDVCSCRDGDAYVSGCTNGNSAECSATGDVNEAAPAASGFSCFLVGASTWLKVRSRSSEMVSLSLLSTRGYRAVSNSSFWLHAPCCYKC